MIARASLQVVEAFVVAFPSSSKAFFEKHVSWRNGNKKTHRNIFTVDEEKYRKGMILL